MSNRNYINGSKFERKVKGELEKAGYLCFRTAGSHGVADVIAVEFGSVLLVQCKISNKISKDERTHLKALCKQYNCRGQIAYREKEGRKFITKYETVYEPR